MILWCCNCQRFLGERPPHDDFRLSHGLCASCVAAGGLVDDANVAALAPLIAYYQRLRDASSSGALPAAGALLDEGLALGLAPQDLLMGLLQPALYAVGQAWSRGEIAVEREHALTARVTAMIELMGSRASTRGAPGEAIAPAIVLACAEGNAHSLGLSVLGLVLAFAGIRARVLAPGLSAEETVAAARACGARAIGLSIALPGQLRAVARAKALASAPGAEALRVLVGGFPIRCGLRPPAELGIEVVTEPEELARRLA